MNPHATFFRSLVAFAIALASSVGVGFSQSDDPSLHIGAGGELLVGGMAARSHQLEASPDLGGWNLIHAIRDQRDWTWTDPDAPQFARRYYRVVERVPTPITAHQTWKNSIELPGDAFLSEPAGGSTELRYVKFALVMDGLPSVYFQDSTAYPFHFHFATERLDPFLGLDLQAFNTRSLHRDGQQIVLGAVLWAPDDSEYGIQFVGQDPYPREFVRFLYQSVDAAITKPPGTSGFYMPTFEQVELARQESDYFAANGIGISSAARWSAGDECYSTGWAIGRLVFVTAAEIDAAYVAGDLSPSDILVTDGVPAEVPFVAGIISFAPTTPNSHVVILARSYGIPFLYVNDEAAHDEIMAIAASAEERLFRCVRDLFEICRYNLAEVGAIDEGFLDELRALKEPPELEIRAIAPLGTIAWPDLATAALPDIDHIGGKAANFGFLRRSIPDNSPDAMAFSFDLWTAYLDQTIDGGGTLRSEIMNRLAGYSWPPDMAALDAALAGVRDLIKKEADFSVAQRTAIIAALNASGFDEDKKLRFRSSTNVEDSEQFVGAGLYDSYSGCLHDDTDDDDVGPSHCDPDQPKERGVFRAMRKVYASFYNRNAFIERLRHGVDESEVGMALLVHHSFPDEIEAANGVATGSLNGSVNSTIFAPKLVSQIGANSVTNPDGGSLPEVVIVDAYRGRTGIYSASPKLRQRSSLLQLGQESVMTWPDDYADLGGLMMDVAVEVGRWNENYEIEFEYKKLIGGDLVIKQVRHVPAGSESRAEFPALVNQPTTWKVFQGERGSVFGNHRLKSQWQIEFDSRWLDADGLSDSFISTLELEWMPHGSLESKQGPPSTWPMAGFELQENFGRQIVSETWQLPTAAGATDFELRITVPALVYDRIGPIFLPDDFQQELLPVDLIATYPTAQLDFQYAGEEILSSNAVAALTVGAIDAEPREGSELVHRTVTKPAASIDIKFYWPPTFFETIGGYTAPLEAWEETTITGLTTQPIVMSGYYSQTYRPEHHNFSEHFLFEPALEPGMSAATLAELQSQDIKFIYVYASGGPSEKIVAVGFDGSTRELK